MMMTVGKIISQPQILLPLLLLKASIYPKSIPKRTARRILRVNLEELLLTYNLYSRQKKGEGGRVIEELGSAAMEQMKISCLVVSLRLFSLRSFYFWDVVQQS